MNVKRASEKGYKPYYGSDEEDSLTPGGKTTVGTPGEDSSKPSETEINEVEEFEKQEKEAKKN